MLQLRRPIHVYLSGFGLALWCNLSLKLVSGLVSNRAVRPIRTYQFKPNINCAPGNTLGAVILLTNHSTIYKGD